MMIKSREKVIDAYKHIDHLAARYGKSAFWELSSVIVVNIEFSLNLSRMLKGLSDQIEELKGEGLEEAHHE